MPLRIWVIGTRTSSAPAGNVIPALVSAPATGRGADPAAAGVADAAAAWGLAGSTSTMPSGSVSGWVCAATGAAAVSAVPSSAVSITAISALLGTVAPSSARISFSTPAYGLGTSAFTLSVITSSSGSYFSTVSPGCFSQRPIVPSATLSPSCGIVTLATGSVPPLGRCARAGRIVGPSVAHPAPACARGQGCGSDPVRLDPSRSAGAEAVLATRGAGRGGCHGQARRTRAPITEGPRLEAPGDGLQLWPGLDVELAAECRRGIPVREQRLGP